MKCLTNYLSATSLMILAQITYAGCAETNPQGPDAVISCAANELTGGKLTAEQFWNSVLFDPQTLDGFCLKNKDAYPTGSTTAQQQIWQKACTKQVGTYFSYASFIAADAVIAAKFGTDYQFMRNSSYNVNIAELANFLATAAQETTGNGILPIKYQQDGLYFRYELSFLGEECYNFPANPNWIGTSGTQLPGQNCTTTDIVSYYTNYFPLSYYLVAVDGGGDVYTPSFFYLDTKYDLTSTTLGISFPGYPNFPALYPTGTIAPPAGNTWTYMNIASILPVGYWIGLGNLQLTNVSITQFFGWYYQHLVAGAPQNNANFANFVQGDGGTQLGYLGDGQLAWEGGLWYWNFRINGYLLPTLHAVLTGPKAACHDIALTTYLINGGCNNYQERTWYYKYFKSNVFGLSSKGVDYTYEGTLSNSMVCTPNLAAYCQSA